MEDLKSANKIAENFIENNNVFQIFYKPINNWMQNNNGVLCSKSNFEINSLKIKKNDIITERNAIDVTIYNCKYKFNKEGFREGYKNPEAFKVSIFFGDSTTFGEGCNENETLPVQFQKHNQEYQSYNYGFLGVGPAHMLEIIKTKQFKEKFKNKSGDVFFIFRDDAIKITSGKVSWAHGNPKYKIHNSKLTKDGKFNENNYKDYLPSQLTDSDFELTFAILQECKTLLKEISLDLNFKVIVLPFTFVCLFNLDKWFKNYNINYTNLYFLDIFYINNDVLFLDGHFNKNGNYILANYILSDKQYNLQFSDVSEEVLFYAYMLPMHKYFPLDDVAVLVSIITKKWNIFDLDQYYIDFFKSTYNCKDKLLSDYSQNTLDNFKKKYSLFDNKEFLKIFKETYTL